MALELTLTDILVLLTFIIILALLAAEKIDKTALALIGATAVAVILFIVPQKDKFGNIIETNTLLKLIPWDTVLFIFFMMMIVAMASKSGLFQWMAIVAIQITKGKPQTLYFAFILLTFIVSFFFDTVTTMLILAPLTIEIMKVLDRDFKPYLIAEAIVANFGSIPSLIGSVPNIVIGSSKFNSTPDATINFLEFLIILGPLTVILLISSIPVFLFFHKRVLDQQHEVSEIDMRIFELDAKLLIKQRKIFIVSLLGLLILIVGFTIGQLFRLSPVLTAMIAMSFLLIETRDSISETLKEVQWGTIFFIVGLLIMVQAIEELEIIALTAELIEPFITGVPELGGVMMLLVGGVLSGVVDNIPISAALAPLAVTLGTEIPAIDGKFIALALIVGVNVGGYLSPIASPANILALSFSESEHNPISFIEFAKIGTTLAILHLILSSIYFIVFGDLINQLINIL